MTFDCIYPQIEERLVPAREKDDYDSEYAAERYDFNYQKWASKQEFISLVRSLGALDLPSAQHIEDIQNISADDLKPIVNLDRLHDSNNKTADVPELLNSNSSSPPEYLIDRTSWEIADDIPTRAQSAALDDFPPLVRCRSRPAMGCADGYVMDMDESLLSDWSFSSLLYAGEYDSYDDHTLDNEGKLPDSGSSSCKEDMVRDAESTDDASWAFISPANSTLPPRSPCTDTLHVYEREVSSHYG